MKKAILVVSFGTSYPETREKTIEACEKEWPMNFQITPYFAHLHRIKLSKN